MIRAEPVPSEPPRAPAWARPGGSFRDNSEAEALFFAGAALSALDSVVRSDPPWAGVWRRRLALKSAAAVAQNLLNRREDEAALRDAIALARPGQALGPAGRVYSAFRVLAGPRRSLAPRAARRRRGRPAVADRAGAGGGTRRRAQGGGGAAGRPRSPRPRPQPRSWRCAPTPSRSRFLRRRRAGWEPELAGPAAAPRRRAVSRAAPRARDGGRDPARPAG